MRYKAPDGDNSRLLSTIMRNRPERLTANLGFASAVAEVGMLLPGTPHAPSANFASAIARAQAFRQDDAKGYRTEFIKLAELASGLPQLIVP